MDELVELPHAFPEFREEVVLDAVVGPARDAPGDVDPLVADLVMQLEEFELLLPRPLRFHDRRVQAVLVSLPALLPVAAGQVELFIHPPRNFAPLPQPQLVVQAL